MEKQEMAPRVLVDLLVKLRSSGAAGEEPVTLHRRGHWFEPSIAHFYWIPSRGLVDFLRLKSIVCLNNSALV